MKLKNKILLFLPLICLLNTSCGTNYSTIFLEAQKDYNKSKSYNFSNTQINDFQLVESSYFTHMIDNKHHMESKEIIYQLKHENNINIFILESSYFVEISKISGVNSLKNFEITYNFNLTNTANKVFNLNILDAYPTSNKVSFNNIPIIKQEEKNPEIFGIIKEDGYYLPNTSTPIYPITRCDFDYGIKDLNVNKNLSKSEIKFEINFDKDISYALIKTGIILGLLPKKKIDYSITKKDLIVENKIQFLALQNGKYNTYISSTI